jgi:hypothetical protein
VIDKDVCSFDQKKSMQQRYAKQHKRDSSNNRSGLMDCNQQETQQGWQTIELDKNIEWE